MNLEATSSVGKRNRRRLPELFVSGSAVAIILVVVLTFNFRASRNFSHVSNAKTQQSVVISSNSEGNAYWGFQIIGTEKFQRQIQSALLLLTNKDPDDYLIFKKSFERIKEAEHSGTWGYENPPTVYIAPKTAFHSLTWCASCLVHDAYHRKLYEDYLGVHGSPVPAEVYHGKEAERICMQHQLLVLEKLGASTREKVWLKMQDGSHYTIPYSNQNW